MRPRLAWLLHAHLPFVRHPEHRESFEETWLFEAIAECYLPLLEQMEDWSRDRLCWRLSMSVTPTLAAMLEDPLLQQRFRNYLDHRIELAESEVRRNRFQPALERVARFYVDRFRDARAQFESYQGDLIGVLAGHGKTGHLELMGCAATHAFLPLLGGQRVALRAQLETGLAEHLRHFGKAPNGIWLPECGYAPEIESMVKEVGYRWFILETHGVLRGSPRPRRSVYAPVTTDSGLSAFGRDPQSAQQVWSREAGYPGDSRYRDFHHDLGHDADWNYVRKYLCGSSQRSFTGIKYHAIGDRKKPKETYDRAAALEAVCEHVEHFTEQRRRQGVELLQYIDRPPIIVAPYDAELFGHWWFEGPEFLDGMMRRLSREDSPIQLTTPQEYLQEFSANQWVQPLASSWGEGGHWKVWLNRSNAWTQPLLRQTTAQWLNWLEKSARMDSLEIRHFNQATRELLLAQSSDWPFLLNAGTAGDYPSRRIQGHLANFNALEAARHSKFADLAELVRLENQNNPFQRLSPWKWVEAGLESSCEGHWKAACLDIPVQEGLSNTV